MKFRVKSKGIEVETNGVTIPDFDESGDLFNWIQCHKVGGHCLFSIKESDLEAI